MVVPLFINPDAAPKDPLPGGLLHKIQVSDVEADHVFENQSEENDITTSAMRIQLDPATAMLTITPTGANVKRQQIGIEIRRRIFDLQTNGIYFL